MKKLEDETGFSLSNSPTNRAGYEILSDLPKYRHESPMLSLDKTKSGETLKAWLGDKEGMLSWKMDGLTVVLTYRDGRLFRAVTRGNGEIGEVVTANAKTFKNIPLKISYNGELVIRGEAVIGYKDFEEINRKITDTDAKYKNPRNLCSGAVRQLNSAVTAERSVNFFTFALISMKDVTDDEKESVISDGFSTRKEQMEYLTKLGFDTVSYRMVTQANILDEIRSFSEKIAGNEFPSDGLVLCYNDIAYGQSLGKTSKFPRDSIAFKWADEVRETKLLRVEWSASRTGLINPVAVFEPVELEGTTVSRASLHNISIMQELELGIGDRINVYKANMIIPQLADNLTRSGLLPIPDKCPACGEPTVIKQDNDVKVLICKNEDCSAKKIKSFTHFVARDAMNIEGLSECTLEKFIGEGFVKSYADIFRLKAYKDQITEMEGFGEKSYNNLIDSLDKARTTTLARVIYGLGIANIGLSNAKLICHAFNGDIVRMRNASADELTAVDGIGTVIAEAFCAYFADKNNNNQLDELLSELTIKSENEATGELEGKTFVITGSIEHFTNRNELKAFIESKGGKVTGSVTSKTDYLINNDNMSNSTKNKSAKELGIPVITEDEFIDMTK